MKKARSRNRGNEYCGKIRDLCLLEFGSAPMNTGIEHTISPIRANAGNMVGGASLCRSIPSKTRTNRCFAACASFVAVQPSSSFPTSTTNCARFSHLGILPSHSTAFATAPIVCSNKCLPDIHSALLIMAYCISLLKCSPGTSFCAKGLVDNASRMALVMVDLPVASSPCNTTFLLGAAEI